jgi:uncharacterized protein YjdB
VLTVAMAVLLLLQTMVLLVASAGKTVAFNAFVPFNAMVHSAGSTSMYSTGIVTAKTVNGYSATCTVTVTVPVTEIVVTPAECKIALTGAITLKATVLPAEATNKTIVWSSSNTAIATVSTTGTVTAKSVNGVVEIYAYNAANDITGVCIVTVGTGKNVSIADAAEIVIYPNPTRGELRMENGEWKMENVEIFDVLGKKQQLSIVNCQLSIEHLPTGIYFIRIKTTTGDIITRKIIKQ